MIQVHTPKDYDPGSAVMVSFPNGVVLPVIPIAWAMCYPACPVFKIPGYKIEQIGQGPTAQYVATKVEG